MSDLISNAVSSPLSQKVAIIGKNSATLASALGVSTCMLIDADVALFIVSATDGIVSADIESWRQARELYVPSIVVINDLLVSDIDFDDMTAIAGKMLDPVQTPYLVLHGEDGSPAALIDLEALVIHDYSSGSCVSYPADHEHQELVVEFREEYLEDLEALGEGAFEAALAYPALPWVEKNNIGLAEIVGYINKIK